MARKGWGRKGWGLATAIVALTMGGFIVGKWVSSSAATENEKTRLLKAVAFGMILGNVTMFGLTR